MTAPLADYLYCIELGDGHLAKIGTSSRPKERLGTLSLTAPFAMRFRRVLRFRDRGLATAHERSIITRATPFRGEWVRLDAKLDAMLNEITEAEDVTAQFQPRQKGAAKYCPQKAEQAVERARARIAEEDRQKVLERIADGYGVEDILVMDGIPLRFSRSVLGLRHIPA